MMPRVNWKSVDAEENDIANDDTLTPSEKIRRINELHRELRDEYRDQQEQERRRDFGDW
jgi:hypothetical protein